MRPRSRLVNSLIKKYPHALHGAICLLLLFFFTATSFAQNVEIHCINVGQGSSELVVGPNSTTILIDGGKSSAGSTLKSYLNTIPALADHVIDYVIASHDDGDHYGGLTYILAHGYSAATIYNCCGTNYGSFGRGVAIPVGLSMDLGGGANVLCVAANGTLINGGTFSTSVENNQSIGLLITYGNFHYLTAGDMESAGEGPLGNVLRTYPSGSPLLSAEGIDVLHVNHHGSRFSTTASYLNNLKPEVAVINVGSNGYGHPHKDAVDRLLARTTYTCDCCDTYQQSTGVTVPAVAGIYQTAAGNTGDCRVSTDGTVVGNIVITYDGGSAYYYLNGSPFPISGGPIPTPTPPPPITLHTDKTAFSTSDTIVITADVRPTANFTPYIRFALPGGSYLYLISGGRFARGAKPFLKGPLTLRGDIAGYGVAQITFSGIAPGSYALQGALVGGAGIIDGINETALSVQ